MIVFFQNSFPLASVSSSPSFLLTAQRAISALVLRVLSAFEMPALRARVHLSPPFCTVMTFTFWFQLLFMSGWFLNLHLKLKYLSWVPNIYCQVRLVRLKYGQDLLWSYHFLFGCSLISFVHNSFSYFCLQSFSNPSATPLCSRTALKRGKSDHIMILLLVTYCYFLNKTCLTEPFMIKSLFTDWRP